MHVFMYGSFCLFVQFDALCVMIVSRIIHMGFQCCYHCNMDQHCNSIRLDPLGSRDNHNLLGIFLKTLWTQHLPFLYSHASQAPVPKGLQIVLHKRFRAKAMNTNTKANHVYQEENLKPRQNL